MRRNSDAGGLTESFEVGRTFRVEKFRVAGGAEIITIFADLKNLGDSSVESRKEVPLVSVLRDTLGDENPENDRLRYVWMLTYTRTLIRAKICFRQFRFFTGAWRIKAKSATNRRPP